MTPDDAGEWDALQAEHDEVVALKPGERRRLERKLTRAQRKENQVAQLAIFTKLRADDRARLEVFSSYLAAALGKTRQGVAPDVRAAFEGMRASWKQRVQDRSAKRLALKRFEAAEIDPDRVNELKPDHPALSEARTIFPSSVVDAWDSERLLVSGANNSKLGGKIEKGSWFGFPVFQLSLQERASCPKSCAMWAGCYGNSMHLARRHNHLSENFLDFLRAELWITARAHQEGFAVRLHTLGDFYSVEYVQFWADMLAALPMLRVWGYTANLPNAAAPNEAAIGKAVEDLADRKWSRFAIRFSNTNGPQGTFVVRDKSEAAGALPCPAQHVSDGPDAKSEACATCGLCWAENMRSRPIAFLQHGMKART